MKKRLILIAVLMLISVSSKGQEFPIGVFGGAMPWANPGKYQLMKEMGVNFLVHHTDKDNHYNDGIKQIPNMISYNAFYGNRNWINYYASGYWSIWEAEENVPVSVWVNYPGIRRHFGNSGSNNGINYVTTGQDITRVGQVFLEGPYYDQDRKYRLFYNLSPITYILSIKAKRGERINWLESTDVFRLDLYYRNSSGATRLFRSKVFNETDISTAAFNDVTLDYTLPTALFQSTNNLWFSGTTIVRPSGTETTLEPYGFYFKITWSGNYELFIDKVEVYDTLIGRRLRFFPSTVADNINTEATTLPGNNLYPDIKYWYGLDEPKSIDNYLPYKIVDNILWNSTAQKRLITAFYPEWDGKRNHESSIERFIKFTSPQRVMYYYYPYSNSIDTSNSHEALFKQWYYSHNFLRRIGSGINMGDYYFLAQGFGPYDNTTPFEWRRPKPSEMRASIHLALANGAKGLFVYNFYSFTELLANSNTLKILSLLDTNFNKTDLYSELQDNIIPRLKGKLGQTLSQITFNRNEHINIFPSGNPAFGSDWGGTRNPSTQIAELITPTVENLYYFHGGLFSHSDPAIAKYIYLTKLTMDTTVQCSIHFKPDLTFARNIRIYDVEGLSPIDTSVSQNDSIKYSINIPPGDGRLIAYGNVLNLGGKLTANDNAGEGMTLTDDMTIENGATLYIYGDYNAKANITVKAGGKIVNADNGRIIFKDGKQLIIEGNTYIFGTANNRLRLVFHNSKAGIIIKPNGWLNISYCDIDGLQNTSIGIQSESPAITIANTSIANFIENGIVLLGSSTEQATELTPSIKNSSILNCGYGISVANISEIVISGNTITDCNLGIFTSQIPALHIVGNNINGTSEAVLPGILMFSSNGNVRVNIIRDHTHGIYLANSSPNIGGNIIEGNSENGLYVGIGSTPNLVRGLTSNPPIYSVISGYNIINDNGTKNDGAEIYLSKSNILLDYGCNQIFDDRAASEPTLLMDGTHMGPSRMISARYNYWGITEPTPARFGGLSVDFIPYNPEPYYSPGPCTTPQSTCNTLTAKTSKGEFIDTISAKNCAMEQISELKAHYAEAEMLYLNGEVVQAKEIYHQIVQGENTPLEELYAYNKLYTIGNLILHNDSYFTELQNVFNNLAQTITDSTLMAIFKQNAILCKVSKGEYASAINDYDNIIQQNPESEQAFYAEMDIITTALLMDTTNNQLGKIASGKYLIKGSSDYLTKLNGILNKNFDKGSTSIEKIVPTEYSLFQNYPNPFNPVTVISWQMPKAGHVSLKIYDMLGKEVMTLVNEHKNEGRYSIDFDAGKFASGVYVYELKSGNFRAAKKLILMK